MEGETNIFLSEIVIDDDATTMRAIQRKEDGGFLPDYATVANKLADLNHRTRGFGDYLYELRNTSQKQSRVNHDVCTHIKRNFTYWVRYHRAQESSVDTVYSTRMTPVLHHFDDHSQCTPNCPARTAAEKEEQYNVAPES